LQTNCVGSCEVQLASTVFPWARAVKGRRKIRPVVTVEGLDLFTLVEVGGRIFG
jgi:hypothetical protein